MKAMQEFIVDALAGLGVFALLMIILSIFNGGSVTGSPGLNLAMIFTSLVAVLALKRWGLWLTHRRNG